MRGIFNSNKNTTTLINSKTKSFTPSHQKNYIQYQQNFDNIQQVSNEYHSIHKPHSREFYLKLIETEKKIQKGNFFQDDITLLIEMYTKCIEFFDTVQDPIKCYFEDKISSTLSSTNILSVLMNPNQQLKPQQQTINGGMQHSPITKEGQTKIEFNFEKYNEKSNLSNSLYISKDDKGIIRPRTLSEQKKQDRMKANYNIEHIKIQQQTDIEKVNVIKTKEHQVLANELHRQNVITQQNKEIQERLLLRKQKNLIQQSDFSSKSRPKCESASGPMQSISAKSPIFQRDSSQKSNFKSKDKEIVQYDPFKRNSLNLQNQNYANNKFQGEIDSIQNKSSSQSQLSSFSTVSQIKYLQNSQRKIDQKLENQQIESKQ